MGESLEYSAQRAFGEPGHLLILPRRARNDHAGKSGRAATRGIRAAQSFSLGASCRKLAQRSTSKAAAFKLLPEMPSSTPCHHR